jgi:phage-related protein
MPGSGFSRLFAGQGRPEDNLGLKLVEDLDVVPSTYFKKLVGTEGIWECRIQYGSDAYRLLCFFSTNSLVVLTHGFAKKRQKTPAQEIERAEAYRRDFLARR